MATKVSKSEDPMGVWPTVERVMARKTGPLESLVLKDHCEMCGHGNQHKGYAPLEAAFNPSGQAQTLCYHCRIGSAELLADQRAELLVQLKAIVVQIEASGRLIVPPGVSDAIAKAEARR
jgi:hypothetical protein